MHPNPRRIVPVILLLILAAVGYWYLFVRPAAAEDTGLAASGTIEAVTVNLNPEVGGRVLAVNAAEGQTVRAGEVLVELDPSLIAAQIGQAQASLAALQASHDAAQAAVGAAQANLALLEAGASEEQLAVAQTIVDKAQLGVDAAEAAYEALPEEAQDTPNGEALQQQIDLARSTLANAQAQYDLAAAGARPEQLTSAQAQVEAALAQARAVALQAEAATAAVEALQVQRGRLTLAAPVDGVILARTIEPGEVANPGATLLVIGQLDELTMTVYVPETRYGQLRLGQAATVAVDSYPGETFVATVSHIADQAEFTPRNVQTAEGRQTTVFAIKLTLANPDGKLKPGMPADVVFGEGN